MADTACDGEICAYEDKIDTGWGDEVSKAGWDSTGNQIELQTDCPHCAHAIEYRIPYIVGLDAVQKVRKWCNCKCTHSKDQQPKLTGCGWGGDIRIDGHIRPASPDGANRRRIAR